MLEWWLTPVIPETHEAEREGSQVQGQTQKLTKTL